MQICAEKPERLDEVENFYSAVIDGLEGTPYHPGWEKGVYPTRDQLRRALEAGELYTATQEGQIVAAMVFNRAWTEGYEEGEWNVPAQAGEFGVIHMLGVLPSCQGRGLAKAMVRYAEQTARAQKLRSIRLDVMDGNLPAMRLYPALGFRPAGTVELFYPDVGRMRFWLFDLVL